MLPIKPKHLIFLMRYNPGILHHSVKYNNAREIASPRRDYSADSDVAKTNWLITKMSKDGRIYDARKVFDEMPERDVITWTTVITGYVRCGMVEEARKLFDRVDAKKDVITWTVMVNGYVRLRRIKEAERLFLEMPAKNVVSWNTIITALSQSGRIEDARKLFDLMPERNVISWTTMVAGLSRNGRIDEARRLFDRMPVRNVVSWNVMVTGYVQNMRLNEAFELFERMPEKNTSSWNTMITGFFQNGDLKKTLKLFNEMPRRDSISWTAMITGYTQDGQNEESLKIFSKMVEDGVRPNEATFASVLSACSNLAGLVEGQQIHQMISKTVHRDSATLVSALVNMYSKCGELSTARKMFDDGLTSWRDLVSWNGMISAYAHHGRGLEAINLFNELRGLGLKPDDVTYVGLLSACSHSGLVKEGLEYFAELVRDGSIQVREEHYTCYVDLCGRAGKLKQAFDFIEQLGTKPSQTVWEALLAGCNIHNDTYIGNLAMQKLLEEGPERAGTYSLLSNIYASFGKWKEAAKVRLKMKEKGLKKQPGCSWIEVSNTVHVFVVGDKSHQQSKLLYSLLSDLHEKMKKIGCVSNKDVTLDEAV